MSVSFRSPVTSDNANSKLLSRTVDTSTTGRVTLQNPLPESGNQVTNLQRALNKIFEATGTIAEDNPFSNTYATENYINNDESYKEAIEALDAGVNTDVNSLQGQITTLNNLFTDGIIKIKSYISDSAYETDNGAPSGGEVYFNTSTNKLRYYDSTGWKLIGLEILMAQEALGVGNGVQTVYGPLTNAPVNDDFLVFVNGVLAEQSTYTYNSPNVEFSTAPALGQKVSVYYLTGGEPATPVIVSGTNQVLTKTINGLDMTAKGFTLSPEPASGNDLLAFVIGGTTLRPNVDYQITGDFFGWDGLLLDGVIDELDEIRIQYFN